MNKNQENLEKDIFQCVRIKLHLPIQTYLENLTSKFHQYVQICCREEADEQGTLCHKFVNFLLVWHIRHEARSKEINKGGISKCGQLCR